MSSTLQHPVAAVVRAIVLYGQDLLMLLGYLDIHGNAIANFTIKTPGRSQSQHITGGDRMFKS